jgi:peptidoglycan/LPS O-acetylase OafA/YrhL
LFSRGITDLKYRSEIDGLRAFAVLAVVFFHAFPYSLPGGFIGVDVFFVISGYLITSIIFTELNNGTFSFLDFFSRRIRRIFPALIIVMAFSLGFGWFALLSDEYEQLGKHIASGAAFILNFVLVNESGYFDNAAETKPMLHLWSLAVEEQFYIVWPFILWLAWKKSFNLLTITIIAAAVSFAVNLKFIDSHPTQTFFLPFGRFWELLSGSILAYLMIYKRSLLSSVKSFIDTALVKVLFNGKVTPDGRVVSNIMSGLGFLMLFYGILKINEDLSFPGFWALIPVVGTLLLLASGSQAYLNRALLMNPVAIWFGLISYPLYLWHWPVLSFAYIIEGEVLSKEIRLLLVVVSIGFSVLTYTYLERPIRRKLISPRKALTMLFILFFMGFLGWLIYTEHGIRERSMIRLVESQQREIIFSESGCPDNFKLVTQCESTLFTDAQELTMVIGDSHARQSYELLRRTVFSPEESVIGISFGGCPTLIGSNMKNVPNCADVNDEILRYIASLEKKKLTIYLAGSWSSYVKEDWLKNRDGQTLDFKTTLIESIRELSQFGEIIILDQVPIVPFNPQRCFSRPFNSVASDKCSFSLSDSISLLSDSRRMLKIAIENVGKIERLNFDREICPSSRCELLLDGVLTYFDETHINPNALLKK